MKRLTRLVKRSSDSTDQAQFSEPPIAPEQPFFAVGDIHGCDDLLLDALSRLDSLDRAAQLIFVGDYVDRGPASAQVLQRLYQLSSGNEKNVVCLMGNHEEMMLRFLDDPQQYGGHWLRHGGSETLASFGLGWINERAAPEAISKAARNLDSALGAALTNWLCDLPRYYQTGNVAVVHAAADPALPLDQQSDRSLTWGHKDFLRIPRQDGLWVVHGHTIMPEPTIQAGRIAIDTGAYSTGRLSAVHVSNDRVKFL